MLPARRDPTGTGVIRNAFWRAIERKLMRIRKQLRQMLVDQDFLGLDKASIASAVFGDDVGKAFYRWFDNVLNSSLLTPNDPWTQVFLAQAYRKGVSDISNERKIKVTQSDRYKLYNQMVMGELQGISDTILRSANMIVTEGLLKSSPASLMNRQISDLIKKVGTTRLKSMAHTFVVRAYNDARLDGYQQVGVEQVGVITETLPAIKSHDRMIVDQEQVMLQTAGDDRVCQECESLAAAGPFNVQDVVGVIPVHPNCRCMWIDYHG